LYLEIGIYLLSELYGPALAQKTAELIEYDIDVTAI